MPIHLPGRQSPKPERRHHLIQPRAGSRAEPATQEIDNVVQQSGMPDQIHAGFQVPAQAAAYRLFKPRIINDFKASKYLVTSKTVLPRTVNSLQVIENMKREMRFEPATSTLESAPYVIEKSSTPSGTFIPPSVRPRSWVTAWEYERRL
jgi:hypothetical protein